MNFDLHESKTESKYIFKTYLTNVKVTIDFNVGLWGLVLEGLSHKTDLSFLRKKLIIFSPKRFVKIIRTLATGFLPEKNLRGVKDNRPLFFKTIDYCFYCSFYCFSKILGGQKSFWYPPVAESQATDFFPRQLN